MVKRKCNTFVFKHNQTFQNKSKKKTTQKIFFMKNKKPTYEDLENKISELTHELNNKIHENNELCEKFNCFLANKSKECPLSETQHLQDREIKENALKEIEYQKDAILNGISTNILFVDTSLRIIWVNKNAAKQANRQPNNMIGCTCHQLLANSETPCPKCPALAAIKSKKSEQAIISTADGRIWDERGEPIFDEKGNLIGIVEIAIEVTERMKAEIALKKSEELFRSIIEKMPIPVLITTGINEKVISLNHKFTELLGYTIQDIPDVKAWWFHAYPDENYRYAIQKKWTERLQIAIATQTEIEPVEAYIVDKQGQRLYLRCHAYSIGDLNLVALIDITEINNVKNNFEQSEKQLKELNTTKDKFFSIISHDLRNPFNTIIGFTNLLFSNVQEGDYERIEYYASILQKSAEQGLKLLDNLLDWSRSQTGKLTYSPEYFPVNVLINEVVLMLDNPAKHKKITINLELKPNIWVFADKNMINTVLRNLISNAIKYTDKNGSITIKTEKKHNKINISITDTGVGISSESIPKLFDLEHNYTTLGTDNEKGTGLGLVLCKEFIEINKGKISLESEKNIGTTFFIELPDSLPKNKTLSDDKSADSKIDNSKKYNILVVEDEEVNYLIIEAVLQNEKVTLLRAKNGREAVDICNEILNIDLILMDIRMPIMNGFEATKIIKQKYPHIPVIIQSAYCSNEDYRKALLSGSNDFLEKPLRKNHVLDVLNKFINLS